MMTEEKALMLKEIKMKEIHFAWDKYEEKDVILPKFKMLTDIFAGKISIHNLQVFTITNYDTTIEQDLDRIYTLRDMGLWAYVAIYDKEHCDPIYKRLQRWCNNRFIFAQCPRFEDYGKKKDRDHDDNQQLLFGDR